MEHFYQNIPGYFNYHAIYRDMVARCPAGGRIVELGSYLGASTAFLCVEAINAERNINVIAVDTWADGLRYGEESLYAAFLRFLEPVLSIDKLTAIRNCSADTARAFPDQSVHSVFVDADHHYASVLADIQAWWPKFAGTATGLFAGHDYDPRTVGVIKATAAFFSPLGITVRVVPPSPHEASLFAAPMKDVASWAVADNDKDMPS